MTAVEFLLPSFIACLILTGIHAYLGIHVISRGVIFIDIALAQIAALGMTVALLFGFAPESQIAYGIGLVFTFAASLFFAFFREKRIPQEAVIGVAFAVSSALALLVADRLPHGSEHLKFILTGNILWVGWHQIAKTAVIYAALGFLHYRFRRSFLLVSTDPEEAQRKGLRLWFWDLLFYLSFGLVITSSVQIGGILLVFSFLIVPALIGFLFYPDLRRRLLLGWLVGGLTSLAGITTSYLADWPTGAVIVAFFGLSLFLGITVRRLQRGPVA
ncbi:MAG: metal ABC transporter permease [Deltaproteobacteria bacterium]|nr:metal ABC transporter permease [Deltaproteobacteria bacterium]